MFGSNRKKQLEAQSRLQLDKEVMKATLENFTARHEKIEAIADVGERYLALVELARDVHKQTEKFTEEAEKLGEIATWKGIATGGGGVVSGVVAFIAGLGLALDAVTTGGLVTFLSCGIGSAGGIAGFKKLWRLEQKQIDASIGARKEELDALGTLAQKIQTTVKALPQTDADGFARSPHFNTILKKDKSLKETFENEVLRRRMLNEPTLGEAKLDEGAKVRRLLPPKD